MADAGGTDVGKDAVADGIGAVTVVQVRAGGCIGPAAADGVAAAELGGGNGGRVHHIPLIRSGLVLSHPVAVVSTATRTSAKTIESEGRDIGPTVASSAQGARPPRPGGPQVHPTG